MLVSIIVPIYNVEGYLPRCIESILNQSYRDIEVILVDDGSLDNSPQICDRYAEHDNRVHVVHKKNGGLVLARRDGAVAATGDYLTFVDGDDFILPGRIQGFADGIQEYGDVDIVCADLSYYPNTDRIIGNTIDTGLYQGEQKRKLFDVFLSNPPFFNFGITPNLVSKCVKREFYCKYDKIPADITLGEDLAVTYNLVLNADSLCVVKNKDYMYEYNESSISHKYDDRLVDKVISLLQHLKTNAMEDRCNIYKQINDYKCMLMKNILLNDLMYSKKTFKEAKRKLLKDLILLDYKNAIDKAEFHSVKDKIIYGLLRKNCFGLLRLMIKIRG